MGIHPEFHPHAPDADAMLRRCDAALLIGDPALQVRPEDYLTTDLAEAWVQWQNRPFVCAVWACGQRAYSTVDLNSVFFEAKEWGLKRRGEIAAVFSQSLKLPAAFLEDYLHRNINYDLSTQHIEGLERFYQLAKEDNLIPHLRPVQFVGASLQQSV
jgi:chorismate dehydratase